MGLRPRLPARGASRPPRLLAVRAFDARRPELTDGLRTIRRSAHSSPLRSLCFRHAADVLVTVLAALAVPGILALVGVRDWRCFGATLLWMPTISAIHLGTVAVVLALGVALLWRWRDHAVRAGLVLGLVVALKLFVWPLILWLAITRRFKAALVAACSSVVFLLVPWIPLGGAGLAAYPHRLSELSSLEAKRGFSPAALLAHLGVGWTVRRRSAIRSAWLCSSWPTGGGARRRRRSLFSARRRSS